MDKNGRIKGKFSIIDIAVIVLVIAVIAGIVIRFGSGVTSAVTSDVTFKYTVKVNGVREFTVKGLEKKGYITDKKSTEKIGEIQSVEVSEAKIQSTTANGTIEWSTLPDRYQCVVTIIADGRESEDGYLLNDTTELSVGRNVDLITKYVKTSGDIISVEVID
ncbi:MAG: DUF4330 domain-containing protein [Clostridiales bacterium]|nr:DUF4330 domain-containing protein [Clostridiales bacterium]